MSFQEQYIWQSQFTKQLKLILAEEFITVTQPNIDMSQASDLMTASIPGGLSIACRMRKKGWPFNEFTIRCGIGSGGLTEYDKIIAGCFANYLIYAHESELHPGTIEKWKIIDLHNFRMTVGHFGPAIGNRKLQANHGDGTSFYIYNIPDIPNHWPIVRRSSHPIEQNIVGRPVQGSLLNEVQRPMRMPYRDD